MQNPCPLRVPQIVALESLPQSPPKAFPVHYGFPGDCHLARAQAAAGGPKDSFVLPRPAPVSEVKSSDPETGVWLEPGRPRDPKGVLVNLSRGRSPLASTSISENGEKPSDIDET